jgi:hypothetical protein
MVSNQIVVDDNTAFTINPTVPPFNKSQNEGVANNIELQIRDILKLWSKILLQAFFQIRFKVYQDNMAFKIRTGRSEYLNH